MPPVRPEFREHVMALWNAGQSSGEIAASLGITRNAAIGIVQRFKGEKRTSSSPAVRAEGRRRTGTKKPAVVPLTIVADTKPAPEPRPSRPIFKTGKPCSIVEIDAGCKWPIAEDSSVIGGHLFCNAAKDNPDRPYCAFHAAGAGTAYSAKLIAHTVAGSLHAYRRDDRRRA